MPAVLQSASLRSRLHRRMARPQRHRLLHGFPLAAAMPFADRVVRKRAADGDEAFAFRLDPARGLLVGVLPHPFCNPKIRGCGFCTFPHEQYSALKSERVVRGVIGELSRQLAIQPELARAKVLGLYFGGGTANLTPPESFRRLSRKLNEAFDLSSAEISLEGVPAYFVGRKPLLVDVMREELSARHFRISMGIQTFSEEWLKRMGRLAFGRPATFAEAVEIAHTRGLTASGDLLFNLPGQTLQEMQADVRRAIDIGLDQICLYHLVMFRGLGTPWSRDDRLLAALPNNEEASENWLWLREYLISQGYRQTTLTNFERAEFTLDARRYRYELMSFEPDQHQMLGFGPGGISYSAASDQSAALKTMNPESALEYLQSVDSSGPSWNRYYRYDGADVQLLHLTRRLAALHIDRSQFQRVFGGEAWDAFADQFRVLIDEALLTEQEHSLCPTPRGMFYADSIAGFLADGRLRSKDSETLNDNQYGHM